MSAELPVLVMIRLTQAFTIRAEITKASLWSGSRSNAIVGLGREFIRKLSLNSFASESKEEMDDGLSWLYHIWAEPLKVVGKARRIKESEVS
ncbi:hypothetical protein GW17_00040286 [Ensete ventricosum]|nr:hypothetical protein GW17_00040286 [Ensete ventricosum]